MSRFSDVTVLLIFEQVKYEQRTFIRFMSLKKFLKGSFWKILSRICRQL